MGTLIDILVVECTVRQSKQFFESHTGRTSYNKYDCHVYTIHSSSYIFNCSILTALTMKKRARKSLPMALTLLLNDPFFVHVLFVFWATIGLALTLALLNTSCKYIKHAMTAPRTILRRNRNKVVSSRVNAMYYFERSSN